MATWHQQNNPILYHTEKWSVVTDPPHGMTSIMRFEDGESAKRYLDAIIANGEIHSYILPPPRDYAAESAALRAIRG